jgi:hypothetical protein
MTGAMRTISSQSFASLLAFQHFAKPIQEPFEMLLLGSGQVLLLGLSVDEGRSTIPCTSKKA